jgi:hypothetical protein
MLQALLGLLLRHGLTLLAGYLVNRGIADASTTTQIVGGLTAAAGIGLSALNKVKVVQKINDAAAKVGDFSNLNK